MVPNQKFVRSACHLPFISWRTIDEMGAWGLEGPTVRWLSRKDLRELARQRNLGLNFAREAGTSQDPPQKKTTWDDLSWDKPWQILSWFISEGWNEHLKSLNCCRSKKGCSGCLRQVFGNEYLIWKPRTVVRICQDCKKKSLGLTQGMGKLNAIHMSILAMVDSIHLGICGILWPYWGLSLVWPSRARSWPPLEVAETLIDQQLLAHSWEDPSAWSGRAQSELSGGYGHGEHGQWAGFEMDRVESWDLLELKFERARKVEQMTNYGHGQQSIWMFQVVESFVWVSSWIWRQCAWCYVTRRAPFYMMWG